MDDLISRQAAIDALDGVIKVEKYEDAKAINDYIKEVAGRIKALPSAQPEIQSDGTLNITVNTDISQIRRVLVSQEGTQYGNMYYADAEPWRGEEHGQSRE